MSAVEDLIFTYLASHGSFHLSLKFKVSVNCIADTCPLAGKFYSLIVAVGSQALFSLGLRCGLQFHLLFGRPHARPNQDKPDHP